MLFMVDISIDNFQSCTVGQDIEKTEIVDTDD